MIKSILFDLDGTLVSAVEWHFLALNQALKFIAGFEISKKEHNTIFNGWPTKSKLNELLKQGRIHQSDFQQINDLKQEYTKQIIEDNIKLDQEKIDLHKFILSKNIKIACITNCSYETAELMLRGSGQLQFIQLLITNEMMKNPKPHGEGFIRGMVNFNSMPEETLIVEDSPKGIQAAHSTGSIVWEIKGPEEVIIENLSPRLL